MKRKPKRLCPLGNSLALIIDKSLLNHLGLGRRTELRVYTEGRRIIAEPIERPAYDPTEAARIAFAPRRRALQETAHALANAISPIHMEALGAGRIQLRAFRSSLDYRATAELNEIVLMDRLEHVRAAIESRVPTDEAIQRAIAAVPEAVRLPRPPRKRVRRSRLVAATATSDDRVDPDDRTG